MLINLLMGLPTMMFCLLMQLVLILVAVQYYGRHRQQVEDPSFASSLIVINVVMLLLVLGNLMQAAIWALLFRWLGEFEPFSEAFYHSLVNFATLGYGDVVMSDDHKLLGPLEAINGVLMIGVSTAALMSAFQDTLKKTFKARQGTNGQHPE